MLAAGVEEPEGIVARRFGYIDQTAKCIALEFATLGQAEVVTDLKERRLARILPEWEPEPIELYALYSSRLAASPKVRVLLEFLGNHCNDAYKLEGLLPDSANTSL